MLNTRISAIVSGLNPEQEEAVSLPVDSGPVMILAGAGTGKTAVLTKRIAYLCAHGVAPENILAVTFTNKAAKEMKERLKKMHVHPAPMLGTFHSIGLRVLKRCPAAAGVRSDFTIMDDDESKRLWRSLFVVPDDVPIAAGELKMHKSDPECKKFMTMMFKAKDLGQRKAPDVSYSILEQSIGRMIDIYESERKRQNRVDFSDLIAASLDAIKNHKEGQAWASTFTHVLVDEFQDTSLLQFEWATSILGGEKTRQNLFAVGDDNQSIYSFRGANVENIARYVAEYGAKEVMLEQNYRCGSSILDAANALIARNVNGDRKKLWTQNAGGKVALSDFQTDRHEAESIADAIIRRGGVLEDYAILVRTRAATIPLAKALRSRGVLHHVVGSLDFFDAKEVKDAMALIRFAINPKDLISFERMAALFPGVGKKAISSVIEEAEHSILSLIEVCASNKKTANIASAFQGIGGNSNAFDATSHLIDVSGLRAECEKADEEIRRENINDFCQLAGQFTMLAEFLEEMTLFADKEGRTDGVTISTIHAAKGLEWKCVYLPALTEGHIPMKRSYGNDAESRAQEFLAKEEERRLMYVAITRAKHELLMSYPSIRMVNGEMSSAEPSSFLSEAGVLED